MPITVLLLLVVEVVRKGREYPPVMRGWWATPRVFQLVPWNAIFNLEPIAVLQRAVVMELRKGQEYPLVLRSLVAIQMVFCFVMLLLLLANPLGTLAL